jgi:NADH:ubiquinone oxidoreductase subunit 1 (chain H)
VSDATFALVAIGAKILFVWVIALATILPNLVWAERRVAGMIQDRPGPNRVGPFGLFQIIADGTKFFMKESVTPLYVDKLLYNLAPWITLMPGLVTFAVIPFGATLPVTIGGVTRQVPLVIADVNIGILYIFAFTGLGIYGIVLAGWSANNKYSLMGGLRASAQIISYELAMGFAAAGVFLAAGTLRLSGVVEWQQQHVWNVVPQFVGFLVFLVAAFAETNRLPFDLAEAEEELAGGLPRRVLVVQVRHVLHGRVREPDRRVGPPGDALLRGLVPPGRRLHRGLGRARLRRGLLREDDRIHLPLPLGPLDVPPIPLRPADGPRLEVPPAALLLPPDRRRGVRRREVRG